MSDFKIGDRVAIAVDSSPHAAGALGAITHIHTGGGYGVLLDKDADQLPAHFAPCEITEAARG